MYLRKIYGVLAICLIVLCAKAQNTKSKPEVGIETEIELVKLIDWTRLTRQPQTPQRLLIAKVLLNANKYALTTWWKNRGFEGVPAQEFLNLKGISEHFIRPVAAESEALALSLRADVYSANVTGVSETVAEAKTIQMIRSLAHAHRANTPDGWGHHWQSALWAGYTLFAGWMMWDKTDHSTRVQLLSMMRSEMDWIMSNKGKPAIKTYRDRSGKIISPGDTGAEENAWDASIIAVTVAMMPNHPEHNKWMNKLIWLNLNAMATPGNVRSKKKYNGKRLCDWLVGSNINENGTVVNHHFIHPDYMTSLFEFNPAKFFLLNGQRIPQAFTLNGDKVFHAFADLQFKVGDSITGGHVKEPGGTIFKPASGDIYYPLGTDWGASRRMNFVMFNSVISVLTRNEANRRRAEAWTLQQGQQALNMQSRSLDGRTYLEKNEDTFASREEWVADKATSAYIFETLKSTGYTFTNKRF